jgi:uncharacterized protein (DUF1778 family)
MSTKVETKKARFDTRLPKEQKLLFERAASIGGYRNLTDFVILSAQENAKKIIQESEAILSSERDRDIFFNAILNPPKPNKKLENALNDFHKAIVK